MEDGTLVFQLAAQLQSVGQIAVVAEGHGTPAMADDHGLGVGPDAAAGGSVADMAGGHVGRGLCQRAQHRRGEHFVDKAEVPVATVALNGAKNAAWLAAEILALGDEALAAKLDAERVAMARQIAAKEEKLQKEIEEL